MSHSLDYCILKMISNVNVTVDKKKSYINKQNIGVVNIFVKNKTN